jgi:hypothetical protein
MSEPRRASTPARDARTSRASGRSPKASVARDGRSRRVGASGTRGRRSSSSAPTVPTRAADQVRWSRVLTAQARIAVGYYERDDVKQRVVDALLREFKKR